MTDLDELPVELVPLGEIVLDPDNARLHNRRNIETIKDSLHRFGQRKPIVVTDGNVVHAGNGTVEAMRGMLAEPERGVLPDGSRELWRQFTHVWATRFPGTAAEARAYAIADNRTSDMSTWDHRLLLAQLQAAQDHDVELLRAAGFDTSETEELARIVEHADLDNVDAAVEWAKANMPEYFDENRKGAYKTTVHFATDAAADAFFAQMGRPKASYFWWPEPDGYVGNLSMAKVTAERT